MDAMLHLLMDTSIFVSLPNGCLCQITGEPLIHMMPSLQDVGSSLKVAQERGTGIDPASKKRSWPGTEDEATPRERKRRKLDGAGGTATVQTAPRVTR